MPQDVRWDDAPRMAFRVLIAVAAALAGCQDLPPGVIAGRQPVETRGRDAEFEERIARLEAAAGGMATEPSDDEVARLRAEVARLTQELAESDRLLAEQFGRRAERRTQTAGVDGAAVR